MSGQPVSELSWGLELLRNATSFAVSQGALLHLSFFFCCSVLNTPKESDIGTSRDRKEMYHPQLRKQIEKSLYHIVISESEMLLPCQCQIPHFEINYGICVCNVDLDFVYKTFYCVVPRRSQFWLPVFRRQIYRPTVEENVHWDLKRWEEVIKQLV
jgi:hypothetical protein